MAAGPPTGHDARPPEPGPAIRWLLDRRLDTDERAVLRSELSELYEHRLRRGGRNAADAWARREYRRWAARLLLGRGPVPSPRRSTGIGREAVQTLRSLARAPAFSLTVVLTLGVGVGGATLVYGVVHAVLVAPLPYPAADDLVMLRTIRGDDQWSTSMADLVALYDEPPPAFEAVAAYTYGDATIRRGTTVEIERVKWVTDSYFPMLGIEPTVGRGFTKEEGRSADAAAVLVTSRYWHRHFGGDPSVLGSTLSVDDRPLTIVGVLPDRLGPLDDQDLYPVLPVVTPERKGPFFYRIVGRLRPDADAGAARAQLRALSERIFPLWQSSFQDAEAHLGFFGLKDILVGDASRALLMVMAGVAFLMLVAVANAASLLVARGLNRRREIAVRAALGAGGSRLFGLVLTEAAVLAGAGGLVGLVLALVGIDLVRGLGAGRLPRAGEIVPGVAVVTFFLLAVSLAWVVLGAVAATSTLHRRTDGLASTAGRATASSGARRLRRALVVVQIAVSIPLLVGAALLGSSLARLQSEDLGFESGSLVSMFVALPTGAYPEPERIRTFWDEMLARIEALPGVEAAGLADARPPSEFASSNNFRLETDASPPDAPQPQSPWITATPGYFAALGVDVLEGRVFDPTLDGDRLPAVVDEAWARRYAPDRSAVGLRFRSGGCVRPDCPWVEVVGVVSGVKTTGLEDPGRGTIYFDHRADTYPAMYLHVRASAQDPLGVVPAIRDILRERDPTVPVADVGTAASLASESLAGRRYTSLLVALLAGVALVLSVVGIYGAMAYFVQQNARDIGIRIALGGGPAEAMGSVVGQGARIAAWGIGLGTLGAFLLTRYIAGLLYGVEATDPRVFLGVCAGTLAVMLAATAIPGRRAAGLDPAALLREE